MEFEGNANIQSGQSMSDKMTILNVDDHPVWCLGMASVINAQPDMVLVAEAATGRQAIELFRRDKPDITLMDVRLPDMNGIEVMIALRDEFPDSRFVVVTSFACDNEIRRALEEGAKAYLLKSMSSGELVDVIRQVHAGKRKIPVSIAAKLAEHYDEDLLTDREIEVLGHLVDGNRNRDIAEKLFIAEETVKAHMKHIMDKLGASDRTQALAIALRRGVIQL